MSEHEYDEYGLVLFQTATPESDIEAQYSTRLGRARPSENQQRPFAPLDYLQRGKGVDELSALLIYQAYDLTLLKLGLEWGE